MVCMYGLTKLRKVQRVSMWGESGRRGPNWRSIESAMKHELDIGRHERMERNRRLKEERLSALEEVRSHVTNKKQDLALMAQAHARKTAQAQARKSP